MATRTTGLGDQIRAALGGLGVAVLATVLSILTALPVVFVADVLSSSLAFAVLFVASYVGYALAGLWALRRWDGRRPSHGVRLPSVRDLGVTVGGIVGLFGLLAMVGVLVDAFGLPTTPHNLFEPGLNPRLLLVLVPLVLFVNAPVEEFLFRYVIQRHLYDTFSRPGAVVVTSLVFMVAHVPAYYNPVWSAMLVSLVVMFVGSCVFGYVYAVTDNLLVPIAVHGAFNAIQALLFYLYITGTRTLEIGVPHAFV